VAGRPRTAIEPAAATSPAASGSGSGWPGRCYADPEMLLAVEPTSAVDAHTEAAIAERLPAARAGRGTLVATTSPVLLDRADVVHYLVDGRVAATGTHRELLAAEPGYRALVTRVFGEEDDARPCPCAVAGAPQVRPGRAAPADPPTAARSR
jgi:ABC-type multidrug transport system ATPase subunit